MAEDTRGAIVESWARRTEGERSVREARLRRELEQDRQLADAWPDRAKGRRWRIVEQA